MCLLLFQEKMGLNGLEKFYSHTILFKEKKEKEKLIVYVLALALLGFLGDLGMWACIHAIIFEGMPTPGGSCSMS